MGVEFRKPQEEKKYRLGMFLYFLEAESVLFFKSILLQMAARKPHWQNQWSLLAKQNPSQFLCVEIFLHFMFEISC